MEDEGYKDYDAILDQDRRTRIVGLMMPSIFGTLGKWHEYVDSVQLNPSAPADVQRNFNRAKNLSLYAWYVYDFHQVAEMDAISTLEMALKQKFKECDVSSSQGLKNLLSKSVKLGWLSSELGMRGRAMADYRNCLAHGTTALHERSTRTLEVCAMCINELYTYERKASNGIT